MSYHVAFPRSPAISEGPASNTEQRIMCWRLFCDSGPLGNKKWQPSSATHLGLAWFRLTYTRLLNIHALATLNVALVTQDLPCSLSVVVWCFAYMAGGKRRRWEGRVRPVPRRDDWDQAGQIISGSEPMHLSARCWVSIMSLPSVGHSGKKKKKKKYSLQCSTGVLQWKNIQRTKENCCYKVRRQCQLMNDRCCSVDPVAWFGRRPTSCT